MSRGVDALAKRLYAGGADGDQRWEDALPSVRAFYRKMARTALAWLQTNLGGIS